MYSYFIRFEKYGQNEINSHYFYDFLATTKKASKKLQCSSWHMQNIYHIALYLKTFLWKTNSPRCSRKRLTSFLYLNILYCWTLYIMAMFNRTMIFIYHNLRRYVLHSISWLQTQEWKQHFTGHQLHVNHQITCLERMGWGYGQVYCLYLLIFHMS